MASRNNTPNRQTGPGRAGMPPVSSILSPEAQRDAQLRMLRLQVSSSVLGELAAIDLHNAIQERRARFAELMAEEITPDPAEPGDIVVPRKRTKEEAEVAMSSDMMNIHAEGYAEVALAYGDALLALLGLITVVHHDSPAEEPKSNIFV